MSPRKRHPRNAELTPQQWVRGERPVVEILGLDKMRELPGPGQCSTGVYFLWLAGCLQYIGQSRAISTRLKAHRRKGAISFDSCTLLPLYGNGLRETERAYIEQYNPPFNLDGRTSV